jgi:hypothetical protein
MDNKLLPFIRTCLRQIDTEWRKTRVQSKLDRADMLYTNEQNRILYGNDFWRNQPYFERVCFSSRVLQEPPTADAYPEISQHFM